MWAGEGDTGRDQSLGACWCRLLLYIHAKYTRRHTYHTSEHDMCRFLTTG